MKLAGFDNLAGSATAEIPLTTVRQEFRLMGREAARLILDNSFDAAGNPHEVLLPTELIIRQSCGARSMAEAKA